MAKRPADRVARTAQREALTGIQRSQVVHRTASPTVPQGEGVRPGGASMQAGSTASAAPESERERRSVRELVWKVLYQVEISRLPPHEVLETTFAAARSRPDERTRTQVSESVAKVLQHRESLDAALGALAEGWRPERLARVDASVLRAAMQELNDRPELAEEILRDASELAAQYSTRDSGRFVMGVLRGYLRRQQGDPAAATGEASLPSAPR
jgi:N utilization substance protein B